MKFWKISSLDFLLTKKIGFRQIGRLNFIFFFKKMRKLGGGARRCLNRDSNHWPPVDRGFCERDHLITSATTPLCKVPKNPMFYRQSWSSALCSRDLRSCIVMSSFFSEKRTLLINPPWPVFSLKKNNQQTDESSPESFVRIKIWLCPIFLFMTRNSEGLTKTIKMWQVSDSRRN